MANGPNIYVSNGTCYSGRRLEANPAMIPCGNDYYGHVACCQASDNCLESGACFNGQFFVTYVAGCTDPEYEDESCPEKFDDGEAPWLGMSYCNGTSDTWVLCDQHRHPETIVSPDPCSCPTATAERTMTMSQFSQINNTASLPSATGLSIAFQPGYYPSVTIPATTAAPSSYTSTTKSQRTSSEIYIIPTAADTPAQPGSRLSTSAAIGTAVGATVFGLLAVAGLGWFLLRWRRQRQALENTNGNNENKSSSAPEPDLPTIAGPVQNDNSNPYSADVDTIGVAYGSGRGNEDVSRLSIVSSPQPSELDSKAARPWSLVSELDGGVVGARPVSMMAGGSPGRMEAILEQGQGYGCGYDGYRYEGVQGQVYAQGHGYGHGGGVAPPGQGQDETSPSELPAQSIAELPG